MSNTLLVKNQEINKTSLYLNQHRMVSFNKEETRNCVSDK